MITDKSEWPLISIFVCGCRTNCWILWSQWSSEQKLESDPETKNTTDWNEQLKTNNQLVLHPHAKIEMPISHIYWVIHHIISHNYIVKERPKGAKILRHSGWNLRWFNSVLRGRKSIFIPQIGENTKFRGGMVNQRGVWSILKIGRGYGQWGYGRQTHYVAHWPEGPIV